MSMPVHNSYRNIWLIRKVYICSEILISYLSKHFANYDLKRGRIKYGPTIERSMNKKIRGNEENFSKTVQRLNLKAKG